MENVYKVALESAENDQEAINWAIGFVFSECEKSDQDIKYSRHIATKNGIEIHYDYGADYYFFCDHDQGGDDTQH